MKKLILSGILVLLPLALWAQEVANRKYTVALGLLGTYQAVGAQAEVRPGQSRWALKLVGAQALGYERAGERGGAGTSLLTYYLPTNHAFIEPAVGLGGLYSWYRWNLYGTSGTLRDLNVGGSLGTNLRFSNRLRTGLHVFMGNGFQARYTDQQMRITGRRLLVLPTLTFDLLL